MAINWDIPAGNQTWLENPRFSSMAFHGFPSETSTNSLGMSNFPCLQQEQWWYSGDIMGLSRPGDFQHSGNGPFATRGSLLRQHFKPEKTRRQHIGELYGFFRGGFMT